MRKFGVEIEITGSCDRARLIREAWARGVDLRSESYNHFRRNYWKLTTDASCGLEIVSPPMTGMDDLKNMCEALKAADAKINRHCGLHVHFDASDFSQGDFKKLAKAYARYEIALDSILPPSRRGDVNHFSRSLFNGIHRSPSQTRIRAFFLKVNRATNIEQIMSNNRYSKVNYQSFARHGTVEIRHHSGTIDFEKISNWVYLLEALITFSKQTPTIREEEASFEELLSGIVPWVQGQAASFSTQMPAWFSRQYRTAENFKRLWNRKFDARKYVFSMMINDANISKDEVVRTILNNFNISDSYAATLYYDMRAYLKVANSTQEVNTNNNVTVYEYLRNRHDRFARAAVA